jgi:hypothetical protein
MTPHSVERTTSFNKYIFRHIVPLPFGIILDVNASDNDLEQQCFRFYLFFHRMDRFNCFDHRIRGNGD